MAEQQYVMVFHHADGRLIGEVSKAWVQSHGETVMGLDEQLQRPQYILTHVIGDRGVFLFNDEYKLVKLTLGEAVSRIMDIYKDMLERKEGPKKEPLSKPSLMTQSIATSANANVREPADTTATTTTIKTHYVRALRRLKMLIEQKERLESQREVYELAITRSKRYLAWCRELALRRRGQAGTTVYHNEPQPAATGNDHHHQSETTGDVATTTTVVNDHDNEKVPPPSDLK